jgi:hypothetical protein
MGSKMDRRVLNACLWIWQEVVRMMFQGFAPQHILQETDANGVLPFHTLNTHETEDTERRK